MKILSAILLSLAVGATPETQDIPTNSESPENPLELSERIGRLSNADEAAIIRCSQAALLLVRAMKKFPNDPGKRRGYFGSLIDSDHIKNNLKEAMPSRDDGLTTMIAAEEYLSSKPKPRTRYEFLAFSSQVSGACSVLASRRKTLKSTNE